jgi:hypothetical protein
MSLRIRRGTESQRASITFDLGELAYTTNTGKLYVGDGVTQGGRNILASSAGSGLLWNATTQQLETSGGGGPGGGGRVQDDTSPALGGDLDLDGNTITGLGNINITGSIGTSVGLSTNLALNGYAVNGIGNVDVTGTITSSGAISNSSLSLNESSIRSSVTSGGARQVSIGDNGITPHTLVLSQQGNPAPLLIKTVTGTTSTVSKITLTGYGGTLASPNRIAPGDYITAFSAGAWEPTTSTTNPVAAMFFRASPTGVVNATNSNGKIEFIVAGGNGTLVQRFLTFDYLGQLSVNTPSATSTLDVNGIMRLRKQTAAPATPYEGMIAVADRVTWDPAIKGSGPSYPVYFDGSAWNALY